MVDKDLNITRDEMLAELVDLVGTNEPPGEGWFSIVEISEATGRPYDTVKRRLYRQRDRGELEMWKDTVSRRIFFRKVVKDD